MNRDRVAGICKRLVGSAKEHWGRLTNDLLVERAGARERLAGRLQERYGVSRELCDNQLKDFRDRNRHRSTS